MAINPYIIIQHQSARYPVYIGADVLDQVGTTFKPRGRVFVVTAPHLREQLADRVAASFDPVADVITTGDGEAHKTLATAEQIITALLERNARRDSTVVVVGGGMLGDTAGFAASVFLRGVDLVHVPTTLLAQVDSSIGGKNGVNHPKGKNLIGTFHTPKAVFSDITVMKSLPRHELLSGVFEAMKAGVIGDRALFGLFETARDEILDLAPPAILDIVGRSVRVKATIVTGDEREGGKRRLLNYGHTIAHGIEAALQYEGLTHGEAVAWGMIGANAIAFRRELLDEPTRDRIDGVIRAYEPRPLPAGISAGTILAATEHDKKNTNTTRVMVLPKKVGECAIVEDVTEEEIAYGIGAVAGA